MSRALLVTVASLFTNSGVHACTVCFGAPSSGLNRGFFWAILLLLVLPFVLMGSVVTAVVLHTRKQNRPTHAP